MSAPHLGRAHRAVLRAMRLIGEPACSGEIARLAAVPERTTRGVLADFLKAGLACNRHRWRLTGEMTAIGSERNG